MKLVLIPLLWILLLVVIEVYGESEKVLNRYKRDHEAEDIDSSENVSSTEIKDVEPLNITDNDEQNTTCIVKALSIDNPQKEIPKRRKKKKIKCKKIESVVPATENIEKSIDDSDSKTNITSKNYTENKQDEELSNKNLDITEKEEILEEVETPCNNNDLSQLNDVSEDLLNSIKLSNQRNITEKEIIKIQNIPVTNINDEKSCKGSMDEIKAQNINEEEVKPEESIKEKERCDSLPTKELENKLNSNGDKKEMKQPETQDKNPIEKYINNRRSNEPLNTELMKKVESQDTKQLLNPFPNEKLLNAKQEFTSSNKLTSDIPTYRANEKDLKSNICTSSDKNDDNKDYLDNQKQGPALGYEQENLQHCIRRYYIYPPLSKAPQSNDFVNDQQIPPEFNTIDFLDNPYPENCDNFFFNMPNNGYITEYQVEDANGHKIPYIKSGDFDSKRNVLITNDQTQRNANLDILNYNPYNPNVYRQSQKSTRTPNFNDYSVIENIKNTNLVGNNKYIPNYKKFNHAAKNDIQDVKTANINKYIPKTNENLNRFDNTIKFTNNNCNEYKVNSNFEAGTGLFSKINENYPKTNSADIITPNGITLNEKIDRQISRDIQTEKFRSIEDYPVYENIKNTYQVLNNKYIPNYKNLNYAASNDIQDVKTANINKYIPKRNENLNDNTIKFTNNNCNEYKVNSNFEADSKLFSKINENYSKMNSADIKTPNGITIHENIDRQISRDIQTEKFLSIEEEVWKSHGNRKLFITDCNKTN